MLHDPQAPPQAVRQQKQRRGHDVGEHPGAERPAQNQQPKAVGGLKVSGAQQGGDLRANRIAGNLGWCACRHASGCVETQREHVGPPGQETVGASQHGVLLVQNDRRPPGQQPRAEHRGDAGIAAEADDATGADTGQNRARLGDTGRERCDRFRAAPQATAGDAGAVDHVLLPFREDRTGQAAGARVGHQHDTLAARHEFRRQCFGREEVATRAAGGDDDWLYRGASHAGSSLPRRLVSASSMPMPNATAMTDDPP